MGKVSESDDKEQPERAETIVPVRYTIQSLRALLDALRRLDARDASDATSGGNSAAGAASSEPETGGARSANPGGQ